MSNYEILTIVIAGCGVIFIPVLALVLRAAIRWTRVEDRLTVVVDDLSKMLTDSDKVHNALYQQMAVDREVTDKRLRFIEEWFMRRGERNANLR